MAATISSGRTENVSMIHTSLSPHFMKLRGLLPLTSLLHISPSLTMLGYRHSTARIYSNLLVSCEGFLYLAKIWIIGCINELYLISRGIIKSKSTGDKGGFTLISSSAVINYRNVSIEENGGTAAGRRARDAVKDPAGAYLSGERTKNEDYKGRSKGKS